MNGGWRVGRIGGIEVRLDASLAILAAIVAFNIWQFSSVRGGGFFDVEAVGLAVGGAIMFIASILLHELAHAAVARLRGIPVSHIQLFVFGGRAHTSGEMKKPGDEFLVTVVGPVSSAVVGFFFIGMYWFVIDRFRLPSIFLDRGLALLYFVGWWNVALALFNFLPGLPLDGGRVFHSAVWKVTGNPYRATTIAGRAGQGLGILLVAGGVWLLFRSNDIWDLWFVLIGWEVHRAASAELAVVRARQAAGTPLREVMTAPPPAVPAELSVRQATESFLNGHEGEAFPVMQDGKLAGFVSSREVREAPAESKVGEFVFQEPGAVQATPEETIQDVMERLGDREWQAILVVDAGRLVGVLEHPAVSTLRRRWTR